MIKKYEGLYHKIVFFYTLLFAIYTLFGRVTLLHALVEHTINGFMYIFAGIFGLFLFAIDFFFYGNYRKTKYYIIYMIFIACAFVSSVLNYSYGIRSNLTTLIWLVVHMLLFTTMGQRFTKQMYNRWLTIFFAISGVIWAGASAVSIYQYFFVKGYVVAMNGRLIRQSFYDNRLFGLFIDPNLGAFVAFLVMWGMVYLIRKYQKRYITVLGITNCVIQFLYIILSGSRSTNICMIASVSYALILLLIRYYKTKETKRILRAISYVAVPVILTVAMSVTFNLFRTGISTLAANAAPEIHQGEEELERKDIEGNETNNRTDIWKGYLYLWKDKPVFGLSPRNAWTYADTEHPDSYIAEHHYDVHNAYIAVFVGMGIVGFLVLAVIIFLIGKRILPQAIDTKRLSLQYFIALQLILNIALFICFYPGIFFTNGIDTLLFWPAVGYALKVLPTKTQ